MKKIENFLFLPVLVLLFYSASKYSDTTIDIHLYDTYYLISSAAVAGWFALWLLIVILLFKRIRQRHRLVHQKVVLIYSMLTLVSLGLFLFAGLSGGPSNAAGYTDADLDAMIFRNKLGMVAGWSCLAVQVIFLIYFVVQTVKKPIGNHKP
ncbi:hypothetical protein FAM09_20720 [Niastella caeni]|uniref:Uncharacterized protein n=1 Tax=Niastella caeni TaxID=2569763 RepID=A0A4S8HRW1_9BACT|nr:hypothetical protein [Niastella caeni]THU35822.1 hypothetical protein FAM09_20720 [Niastella caeni]